MSIILSFNSKRFDLLNIKLLLTNLKLYIISQRQHEVVGELVLKNMEHDFMVVDKTIDCQLIVGRIFYDIIIDRIQNEYKT